MTFWTVTDAAACAFLYEQCGFRTVEEGLDLVEAAYPRQEDPVRVQYLLDEHLSNRTDQ